MRCAEVGIRMRLAHGLLVSEVDTVMCRRQVKFGSKILPATQVTPPISTPPQGPALPSRSSSPNIRKPTLASKTVLRDLATGNCSFEKPSVDFVNSECQTLPLNRFRGWPCPRRHGQETRVARNGGAVAVKRFVQNACRRYKHS